MTFEDLQGFLGSHNFQRFHYWVQHAKCTWSSYNLHCYYLPLIQFVFSKIIPNKMPIILIKDQVLNFCRPGSILLGISWCKSFRPQTLRRQNKHRAESWILSKRSLTVKPVVLYLNLQLTRNYALSRDDVIISIDALIVAPHRDFRSHPLIAQKHVCPIYYDRQSFKNSDNAMK